MKSIISRFHQAVRLRPALDQNLGNDLLARLPFELHLFILAHLGPSDVSAALAASRSLRHIWLSEEIWPALANLWYPGLGDHIRSTAVHSDGSANGDGQAELFRTTLHHILLRTRGRFGAALQHEMLLDSDKIFRLSRNVPIEDGGVHDYDHIFGPQDEGKRFLRRFMMYDTGRIAWWPEAYTHPYFAVVDDFRTRMRRAYLFPDHNGERSGYKTAMSSKLLIMGRGSTLHAWHLEQGRLQSIEVPGFRRCVAEGEKVLVISKDAVVHYWKYGQAVQRIDMDRFPCYNRGPLSSVMFASAVSFPPRYSHRRSLYLSQSGMLIDFILSPDRSNTFYVITLTTLGDGRLQVYEICDSTLVGSYQLEPDILLATDQNGRGGLHWEKIDCHGGYSLMDIIFTPEISPCPCGKATMMLATICFNVYTKSLTTLFHHLDASPWPYHIWNKQLVIGYLDPASRQGEDLVRFVKPCAGTQDSTTDSSAVPLYDAIPDRTKPWLRRRKRTLATQSGPAGEEVQAIDFILRSGHQSAPRSSDGEFFDASLRLVGDDDFVVFVQNRHYSAWSFGDEIPSKPRDRVGTWSERHLGR